MRTRDDHRPVLCRIVDDLDFQDLSPDAQRLWFFLRVSPECGPTGLFRFYPSLYRERLRMTEQQFAEALGELARDDSAGGGPWVKLERGYVLLRNALRYEPGYCPENDPKHLRHLHAHLETLGHLRIAHDLLAAHGLPEPVKWATKAPPEPPREPDARPSEGPSEALARPSEGPVPRARVPSTSTSTSTSEKGGGGSARARADALPSPAESLEEGFARLLTHYPASHHGNQPDAKVAWCALEAEDRTQALAVVARWVQWQAEVGTAARWWPALLNWIKRRRWSDAIPDQLQIETCWKCGGRKTDWNEAAVCDACRAAAEEECHADAS